LSYSPRLVMLPSFLLIISFFMLRDFKQSYKKKLGT